MVFDVCAYLHDLSALRLDCQTSVDDSRPRILHRLRQNVFCHLYKLVLTTLLFCIGWILRIRV